jgi:tRNA splicing endonuclease
MNIIMNEKEEAERIIKNNEINMKKPSETIQLLIKYYYNEKHMNKEDIRTVIECYMQKNYKEFNSTKWQNSLDRAVQIYASNKYKLININRVFITDDEFKEIEKLNDIELEKVAFVLLVYAKTYNQINEQNNNWVRANKIDILKDAKNKSRNKINKYKLFTDLNDKGYIDFAKKINNTNIQVKHVNNLSPVKIEINNLKNFISEYLKCKEGYCIICGKPVKKKNNRIKYCKQCAKEIKQKQTREVARESMRKLREKRKC